MLLFTESEDERSSQNICQDIEALRHKRVELVKQREGLDAKLKEGSLLNVEEERRYYLLHYRPKMIFSATGENI